MKQSHFTRANACDISQPAIQAIPAIFIRYLANETAEKLNFFPAIHARFSPSSVLTMRNTVPYHNLVMYRLMMS